MKEIKKMGKIIFPILGFIIFGTAAFFMIRFSIISKNEDKKSSRPPQKVSVIKVIPKKNVQNISYPACVEASCEATLFFRVSGPIVEVNVKSGDKVKKNTVLFKIDSRDYERKKNLLKHQITSAEACLEKAILNYVRYKNLYVKAAVSKQTLDHSRSEYLVAKAKVAELKSSLKIASDRLEDTELKAPFDGVITEHYLEKHEMARAGEPVLKMHNIAFVEVVAFIPEDDIVELVSARSRKNSFYVCFPAMKSKKIEAELYEWQTKANRETRTYGTIFRIKQPHDNSILPGMTAELIWKKYEKNKSSFYNLPLSAFVSLTSRNGKIWIIDPKTWTAMPRIVGIGKRSNGESLQVISGLEPNTLVVIEGNHFLRKGARVEKIHSDRKEKNEDI